MRKICVLILAVSLFQACQTKIAQISDDAETTESFSVEDTTSAVREAVSVKICDKGIKPVQSLYNFFMSSNPLADEQKVLRLARFYVDEAAAEGVNSDVAFVQMCLETGFLKFGGLVSEDMHNFCGLGAMSETQRGLVFENEQLGVRAHIQHLHAYGCTEVLKKDLIDTRYKYVNPRGKAPTIYELAGTWASDREYGNKLNELLTRLSYF